jgi:hypothetical protein
VLGPRLPCPVSPVCRVAEWNSSDAAQLRSGLGREKGRSQSREPEQANTGQRSMGERETQESEKR